VEKVMEETPQQKATMPADTSIVQSGNQVGHIDALGDGAGSQHGDSTYTGALPTLLFSVGPPFGLWSPGLSFPIELEECVGPQPKGRQRGSNKVLLLLLEACSLPVVV
jgi:hypothetical protein